jgi:hypothetical protein
MFESPSSRLMLFEQLPTPANRTRLDAVGHLAQAVILGLLSLWVHEWGIHRIGRTIRHIDPPYLEVSGYSCFRAAAGL